MAESGIVQAVYDVELGSVLTADATAADETLYVASVAYFAPNGGTLTISDGTNTESAVAYTGVDEDTSTLTGVTPLVNGYAADDTAVLVYPTATERVAEVRLDGQQDTVRARIPFSLFDRIATGFYDEAAGETIRVLVQLEREYVVVDVLGQVPSIATDSLSVVEDLRVEGTLTIENAGVVELESGVAVSLSGQQREPASSPGLVVEWPGDQFDYRSGDWDSKHTRRLGFWHDATNNVLLHAAPQDASSNFGVRVYDFGTETSTLVVAATTDYFYGCGVVRVGTDYYALTWHSLSGDWRVRKYDSSWVYQSQWTYSRPSYSAGALPMLTTDGTDLWIADPKSDGTVRMRRFDTTGASLSTVNAELSTDGDVIAFLANQSFDYGVTTFLLITGNDPDKAYAFDSTGARQSTLDFPVPLDGTETTPFGQGMTWDGSRFYVYGNGTGTGTDTSTVGWLTRYELTDNHWTSGSSKWWVGYSWFESGASSETTISPKSFVTMSKRAWLRVVADTIPEAGTLPPDSFRAYVGNGSSEPADTAMYLQATGAAGVQYVSLDAVAFSGTAAPTSNTFPADDAATIAPTQDGWSLNGDGTTDGFGDIQVFTADGTWTKPADTAGMTVAELHLIGGGGGGGSGRRGSTSAGGGAGGGGGSAGVVRVPLSFLSSTATVTVGAGGAGGAARSTNLDGEAGTAGEDTTFVSGGYTYTAKGGAGGAGGPSTGSGGAAGTQSRASSYGVLVGGSGADGGVPASVGSNATAVPATSGTGGAGGGGGGGGYDGSQHTGGDGADSWDVAGTVGRGGSTAPSQPSTKMVGHAYPGGGAGGSGSTGVSVLANAQAGGAGGLYGGGGGGGGASVGYDSGAGGAGAQGIVVVVCY